MPKAVKCDERKKRRAKGIVREREELEGLNV